MRRLISVAAALLGFALLSLPTGLEAHGWEKQAKRVMKSLVVLEEKDPLPLYGPGACTAWFVDTWLVVTAAHCVDGDPEMRIAWAGGKVVKEKHSTYRRLHYDKTVDIAILQINRAGRPLTLAKRVQMGQSVATVGFRGRSMFFLHGFISAVNNRMFHTWPSGVLLDENFVRGMSGSPVLNEHGNVVGLALGGGSFVTDLQTFGYVLPASYIHIALNRVKR